MNPHLDFLLSSIYDGSPLHPDHLADLRRSGLTDQTITAQKIRTVPPNMIDALLGFPAPKVQHAYVIPFADPAGGWMDHVRLKVFGEGPAEVRGDHTESHRERYQYNGGQRKYLVRRRAVPRLFFPVVTITTALHGPEALWVIEGPKKALAVAQLGLPAVGIESAWGWHLKSSTDLLPDFNRIAVKGRVVKIVPDPDVKTNPMIARAMYGLAETLERRGSRVEFVALPAEVVV
jgi:hypothetical protein